MSEDYGVLERLTASARRVVVLAQEEARVLNHDWIGTEHLLLGLIREGEGDAAAVLERAGLSLDAVRSQVRDLVGECQAEPMGRVPFTPRAKRVLELSLRESLRLTHDTITTGHVLLGLIREGDGVAMQVLRRLGADPDAVRGQVIERMASKAREPESRPAETPSSRLYGEVSERFSEEARQAIAIARQAAAREGRDAVSARDLFLALLFQGDRKVLEVVTRLLADVGADPARLEAWVREARGAEPGTGDTHPPT